MVEPVGAAGGAGGVRSTGLPYLERIPAVAPPTFVKEITARYLAQYPPDTASQVHVALMRREVEAGQPGG